MKEKFEEKKRHIYKATSGGYGKGLLLLGLITLFIFLAVKTFQTSGPQIVISLCLLWCSICTLFPKFIRVFIRVTTTSNILLKMNKIKDFKTEQLAICCKNIKFIYNWEKDRLIAFQLFTKDRKRYTYVFENPLRTGANNVFGTRLFGKIEVDCYRNSSILAEFPNDPKLKAKCRRRQILSPKDRSGL